MNSVLIHRNEILDGNIVNISKQKSLHLIDIVKVKVGETLKATIIDEGITTCLIKYINDGIVTISLGSIQPAKSYPITLIIAASRPPTMKKVIEHATALGVDNFIIIGAQLTEKSYLQSKLYQSRDFYDLAGLGLSQSVCFYKLPKISLYKNIMAAKLPDSAQKYILSPYTQDQLVNQKINISQNTILAIGPERGWSFKEIEFFKELGFKDVAISPSILRVEIATFCSLGILNSLMNF